LIIPNEFTDADAAEHNQSVNAEKFLQLQRRFSCAR